MPNTIAVTSVTATTQASESTILLARRTFASYTASRLIGTTTRSFMAGGYSGCPGCRGAPPLTRSRAHAAVYCRGAAFAQEAAAVARGAALGRGGLCTAGAVRRTSFRDGGRRTGAR